MEFWGVEVKPGQTVTCDPGEERYLHLSQASLGETKKDKGNENVLLFVKLNNKKLVLGTLSAEKCAQISYDLVFEKEFELSHSSKNASVYFCGYKTNAIEEDDDYPDSNSDSEEDIQLGQKANGKSEIKDEQAKPTAGKANAAKGDASAARTKVKTEESNKVDKTPKADADDEDDDNVEDSEEDESDDDEDMAELGDDSDDEDKDESSDEEDEATPVKTEAGKKRQAASASKTPVPEKKAKVVSPVGSQKTGGEGKKGVHTATPYPAKQVGKTPVNNDKAKQHTPKFGGSVACKSCSKTFNSENALQAHTKAKHGTAK